MPAQVINTKDNDKTSSVFRRLFVTSIVLLSMATSIIMGVIYFGDV